MLHHVCAMHLQAVSIPLRLTMYNRHPIDDSVAWLLESKHSPLPIMDLLADVVLVGNAAYKAVLTVRIPTQALSQTISKPDDILLLSISLGGGHQKCCNATAYEVVRSFLLPVLPRPGTGR